MNRKTTVFLAMVFAIVALAGPIPAQAQGTPYAGLEVRDIKALSSDQVEAYRSGSGMGLALAAELNRHPGPKHVLELAHELQLTENQKERTRSVFSAMELSAIEIGTRILEMETKLDERFASASLSEEEMAEIVNRIAIQQGSLRATHLKAHLEMVRILSSKQVERYQNLRGYDQGGHDGAHSPEHHQMEKHSGH